METMETNRLRKTYGSHTLELDFQDAYLVPTARRDDLTGVRIWPGAELFCEYLVNKPLRESRVIEVGAGLGLCSILLSKVCSSCSIVVTDGSREAVRLVERNIALNDSSCQVAVYRWGSTSDRRRIIASYGVFDLIFACDIVYPDQTNASFDSLFEDAQVLLEPTGRLLISYVHRSYATCKRFFASAYRVGLTCSIVHQEASSAIFSFAFDSHVIDWRKQAEMKQWYTEGSFDSESESEVDFLDAFDA